jgi:hypothetical protein
MKNDNTVITDFFGSTPEIKILEWLWEYQGWSFTFTQCVDGCRVGNTRGYDTLHYFVQEGILIESIKKHGYQYYKLNTKSLRVKNWIKMCNSLFGASK